MHTPYRDQLITPRLGNRGRKKIMTNHPNRSKSQWVTVARIPQIDGGTRIVQVERKNAAEVKEALRDDPARIDGLWCPIRTRDE